MSSGVSNVQEPDRRGGSGGQEARGLRGRTAAEWTTLAISVILVLGLVALVTYVSINGGNEPPVFQVRALQDEVRQEGAAYYLPVQVMNQGGRTAEEVVVHAELVGSDGSAEESEFTIDFLAGGESEVGTVVFATDPSSGDLTVDVASFQ